MTPSERIAQPEIPKSEFAEATEYELREAIGQVDRHYQRSGSTDLLRMSQDLGAAQWIRYTALCRALRAKSKPSGKSQGPPQG